MEFMRNNSLILLQFIDFMKEIDTHLYIKFIGD